MAEGSVVSMQRSKSKAMRSEPFKTRPPQPAVPHGSAWRRAKLKAALRDAIAERRGG